ncbi:PKD domain-containing protein [Acidobacteria bacterium AH-259-L09]|nr:PKD domain-containing protein [Acidobacteria bacterium AH-259-L09]
MRKLKLPLLLSSLTFLLAAGGCVNRPPVLNCVVDPQTVTEGDSVTIETNASDPNNDPLSFDWGATRGKVTPQNGSAVWDSSGVLAGLTRGRYTITAEVRDKTHTVPCSVFVTVEKNKQAPTIACDPSNVRVTEGRSRTLQASASDPNNDALTYAWSIDGEGVENNQPSFQFGTTGRSIGSHAARVTVTDVDGLSANCSFNVTIDRRPNRNPTVTLTLDKREVYAGETVSASAQGSDPDGDPLSYSWTLDAQRRPETSSQVQINTSGLAGGSHSVAVTVRDDRDGTASDTKSVSVREKTVLQMDKIRPDNLAKAKLDEIALKMQQNPQLRATITGHTDDRGSERANERVGQRRADAVKDYLVKERSIDGSRIETRSAGESQPISDNKTPEGRKENRRAEVELFVP